jgi:hypothetical protein
MDLIDRYLVAVRRQLPQDLQDDVIAELKDSLRSEAEDHEASTGHPMSSDEQSAMLKKRGHPFLMASRYVPQQFLIGPALFPYYRQTLKFVVFWVVLPIVLIGGAVHAIYAADPAGVWSRVIAGAWNGAIYSVGIVTLVFTILENTFARVTEGPRRITLLDRWNPAKLPDPQQGRLVPRSESVISLVFTLTFLVWWTGLVRVPEFPVFTAGPVTFVPAPVWGELYYPILFLLLSSIVIYVIDMARPWRTLTISAIDVVVNLFYVAVVVIVLRAWHLVDVTGDPQHASQLDRVSYLANNTLRGTFMVIGLIASFDILYELWKMLGARRSTTV